MKVLITGANGFVGSHLCEKLLLEGHSVYALVRSPKKFTIPKHPNLVVIQGDLNLAPLSWVESLPLDLNTVIHTAGIVHSFLTDEFYHVNTTGTQNLINHLKRIFSHLHFILISSLAAGGPSLLNSSRNEDDTDSPISIYGKSKKKAEEKTIELSPKEWILTVIRPPMVIGPRDSAVLDIFKMVQSGLIILPGSNSKTKLYSFVCVFDLVETISRIIVLKKEGVYYSAYPEVISFNQLILEIKKQLSKKRIFYIPLPLFLVRILALSLGAIYKIVPHSLRLTPDKFYELAATNWTCCGIKSIQDLEQVYHYDLGKTVSVTLMDYKSRNWL